MADPGVPADLANMSKSLKERHIFPNLIKQYISKYPILKLFQRQEMVSIDGRNARWNVETRGAVSFGAVPEHAENPPADTPGFDEGIVAIATLMTTIEISLQAMQMSKRQTAAFVASKVKLMTSAVEMFMQNLQRVFIMGWGDGCLAKITAIDLDTPTTGTQRLTLEAGMSTNRLFGPRYMLRGLRLGNSATRAGTDMGTANLQVVGRDLTNNYVFVKGVMGDLANGDFLYFWRSKNKMPVGILLGADDGTTGPSPVYHNINRLAVGKEWAKGRVIPNVGGADLEDTIQRAVDDVGNEGGGEPNYGFMEHRVWRRFARNLRAGRVYIGKDDPRYVSGVSAIAFVGAGNKNIALQSDRDIPDQSILLIDLDKWHIGEVMKPQWVGQDAGDGAEFKRVGRTNDFEANFGTIGNSICEQPNANAMLLDVAV